MKLLSLSSPPSYSGRTLSFSKIKLIIQLAFSLFECVILNWKIFIFLFSFTPSTAHAFYLSLWVFHLPLKVLSLNSPFLYLLTMYFYPLSLYAVIFCCLFSFIHEFIYPFVHYLLSYMPSPLSMILLPCNFNRLCNDCIPYWSPLIPPSRSFQSLAEVEDLHISQTVTITCQGRTKDRSFNLPFSTSCLQPITWGDILTNVANVFWKRWWLKVLFSLFLCLVFFFFF